MNILEVLKQTFMSRVPERVPDIPMPDASPFLLLPAELRFHIYNFLFSDSSFWISRKGPRKPFLGYRTNTEGCEWRHQILLTCHFIYKEARSKWASSTFWTFPDQHILRTFSVDKLGLRSCIKYLHLTDLDDLGPIDWLDPLTNLKTLTIDVPLIIAYWSEYLHAIHLPNLKTVHCSRVVAIDIA